MQPTEGFWKPPVRMCRFMGPSTGNFHIWIRSHEESLCACQAACHPEPSARPSDNTWDSTDLTQRSCAGKDASGQLTFIQHGSCRLVHS